MAIDEVNLETRWNRSAMVQLVGMHRFSTLRRVWNGFRAKNQNFQLPSAGTTFPSAGATFPSAGTHPFGDK